MTTIDEVVKKKLKTEVLNKPRFLQNGNQLHGYEVFKLLQTPTDNDLRNILHVNNKFCNQKRTYESPLEHWAALTKRANAFQSILNTFKNLSLTFCQLLQIALLVSSLDETNTAEMSIANDIYKPRDKSANE